MLFRSHLLEDLGRYGAARIVRSPGLAVLSAMATAALPLVVLGWGARSRRTFVLDTGIVLLVLSLVTLRHYVHLAPLWVVLKMALFVIFFIWVRATLPRLRYDQLMSFGWKVLLPLATVNVLATAVFFAT